MPTKVSRTSLLHIFYFDAKHGNKESKNKESSVSGIWFLFIVFSPFFAWQVSEKRSCSHVVQLLRLRFVWCYLKFSCHCLIPAIFMTTTLIQWGCMRLDWRRLIISDPHLNLVLFSRDISFNSCPSWKTVKVPWDRFYKQMRLPICPSHSKDTAYLFGV